MDLKTKKHFGKTRCEKMVVFFAKYTLVLFLLGLDMSNLSIIREYSRATKMRYYTSVHLLHLPDSSKLVPAPVDRSDVKCRHDVIPLLILFLNNLTKDFLPPQSA